MRSTLPTAFVGRTPRHANRTNWMANGNVLPDASVLTTLVLSFEEDALVRTETYLDAHGVAEETVLYFVRPDES